MVKEPYFSSAPTTSCDCKESVHDKVKELIPHDAPALLGKYVVTVIYHDANLHHNVITSRSVIGVLDMLNKTPVDWHSKNQSSV